MLFRSVADVLRFAREGRLARQPVALRAVVDEALADLAATLGQASVTVKVVERDRCETRAELDRGLCAQAVANLVRNAVEAMASTPVTQRIVRIELGRERRADARGRRADHVTVAVEDRGPGVPDAEFVRIFRPFASGTGRGTGLGLAIVHRVVDAHGGRVTVRNLEVGARFEISLPIVADEPVDDAGPDDPLSLATWRRLGRDGPPRRAG